MSGQEMWMQAMREGDIAAKWLFMLTVQADPAAEAARDHAPCQIGAVKEGDRAAQASRGPNRISAAPPRQIAAPIRSQRSGRDPSISHSQNSDAVM